MTSEDTCHFCKKVNIEWKKIKKLRQSKKTEPLSDEISKKLDSRHKDFTKSDIWKNIKTFHSDHGSWNLEAQLQHKIVKHFNKKYPDLEADGIEEKTKNLLENSGFKYFKPEEFKRYTTDEAELQVDKCITRLMLGRPGLLIRNIRSAHKVIEFQHITEIFPKFAPYCSESKHKEKNGKHSLKCKHGETDLLLVYPGMNKVHVLIIEVKRETHWLKENLVESGLEQLKKDMLLIHNLLPDIPKENLEIKTFLAFPKQPALEYPFCRNCLKKIITKDNLGCPSSGLLLEKLEIPTGGKGKMWNKGGHNLFMTTCYR